MANFKVGDEVICIDAGKIYRQTALVRGGKYIVHFLAERCVALEGVVPLEDAGLGLSCGVCGNSTVFAHFFPSRFIKLDGVTCMERDLVTNE